jgi:hypothetical protein
MGAAVIYAGLGDVENTLAYLEKGVENRGMSAIMVKCDPRFDLARSEPRYHDILKRMNLG